MTSVRDDLLREEEARSRELWSLLGTVDREDIERVGYQDDWSVKDLIAHLAAWQARAAADLEQMRTGTYPGRPQETPEERLERLERENRDYREASADQPWDIVRAEWWASRNRMLEELGRAPEVTEEAAGRFRRVAVAHYDDHVDRLKAWIAELAS